MTPTPPLSTAVADLDLPMLPEPKYCADDLADIFTVGQMQDYARAAVVAALARSAAPASDIAAAPEQQRLSNDEIDMVWQSMPGGPSHWLKGFGYQQFAKAIEDEVILNHRRTAQPAPAEVSPPDGAMPEQFDEAVANLLAEHTNLTQDGIDEHAMRIVLALNYAALRPVTEESIAEWREQGYLAAQPAEGSAQVAMAELLDLLRNVRPNFNSAGSRTEVRAYEATQARIARAIELLTSAPEVAAPERSDTPAGLQFTDRDGRLTDEARDLIEGMSVSIDVSTGEHDIGNRLFGVVNEVMDDAGDKCGVTLLVYDAKPNFATPTAASKALDAAPAGLDDARDAARYRWLRNQNIFDQIGSFAPYAVQGQTMIMLDGADLDKEVDREVNRARIDGDKQGAQGEKA